MTSILFPRCVIRRFCIPAITALVFISTVISLSAENDIIFCVIGDCQKRGEPFNRKVLDKLIPALKSEKPAFILIAGDLVSGYSSKLEKQLILWRDYIVKPLNAAGIKVYPCRGNHDASNALLKYSCDYKKALDMWRNVFSGKYALPGNGPEGEKDITYFVEYGNILVFIFDDYASKKKRHSVNTDWFRKVLKEKAGAAGKNKIHIFAMSHEPAYTVCHKDCLAVKKKKRDEFINLLTKYGGHIYFCGHDHFYNRAFMKLNGITFNQMICGGAGATQRKWKGKYADKRLTKAIHKKEFGYTVIHIKDGSASVVSKCLTKDGKPVKIDEFKYSLKSPECKSE